MRRTAVQALLVAGAIGGALAVMTGAFGAHALSSSVSPARLATWQTAAHYHLAHSLALLACGLAAKAVSSRLLIAAGWLFAVGILLFSGSLYALVLLDVPALGAVTPLGGVALIAAWGCLAVGVWRGAAR